MFLSQTLSPRKRVHCNVELKTKDIRVDVLGEACGAEITERLLLPTVIGMSTDSVANVR